MKTMTFDEVYEMEALGLFDRKADLEISQGDTWVPLYHERTRAMVFADRSRACEIASPHGIKLSSGQSVRFRLGQPKLNT